MSVSSSTEDVFITWAIGIGPSSLEKVFIAVS
jgi:hypothetical protein